jgi:phenylacetate-CoA ligase
MLARYLYYFFKLRRNLRLKPVELMKIQNMKMKVVVRHAYEHVPFYHRKFDKASVKPDDIRSIEDLTKIPMTTKTELQARPLSDLVANTVNLNDCLKQVTSGSTGIPLTIVVDKGAEDFRDAMWARAYYENGLRLMDKLAIIQDPHRLPHGEALVERLRSSKRRKISIFDDPECQARILETFRPDAIKGYASSLAILANFLENRGRKFNPHSIFTGAELLFDTDRKLIASVFDCDVLDYYGSTEFSLLGWECSHHAGYHINSEGTLIEFIKDGKAVSSGERGDIVCTGLVNYAMPLIRYRIGDEGVPIDMPCPCGRPLPLLKILDGRTGDFLVTLDGKLVPPTAFSPYPFANLRGIKRFRVIQETRKRITIQVVLEKNLSNTDCLFNQATSEIQRVFGESVQVNFQILDNIEKDPTGKLRKIVSHVTKTR